MLQIVRLCRESQPRDLPSLGRVQQYLLDFEQTEYILISLCHYRSANLVGYPGLSSHLPSSVQDFISLRHYRRFRS